MNQINTLKWSKGITVGIIDIDNKAHKIASSLKGIYNSMEEIERRALIKFCNEFENKSRENKILSVLKFSSTCMTKVKSEFNTIISCIENGKKYRGKKHQKPLSYPKTNSRNFEIFLPSPMDSLR